MRRSNAVTFVVILNFGMVLSAKGADNRLHDPVHKDTILPGTIVRITAPGTGTYWWAHMDISPSRPSTIMVCGTRTVATRNASEGYVYLTEDYGKTWREVLVDASTKWVSEQSCAFGRDGNAYFLSSRSAFYNGLVHHDQGRSSLYISSDHGKTWAPGAEWPFVDYSATAVNGRASSAEDSVFIFANGINTADPTSGPGLLTYFPGNSRPVHSAELPKSNRQGKLVSATPTAAAVLEDGSVIGSFVVQRSAKPGPRPWADASTVRESIEVARSDDKGVSLIPPMVVSSITRFGQLSESTMAVDHSFGAHRGRVYVSWAQDTSSRIEIMLTTSDDGGRNWERRSVRLMPDRPRELGLGASPGITPPAVAVNNQGVVGLFWIENEGRCPQFAASLDGGKSFRTQAQIGPCSPIRSPDLSWYSHYLFTWPQSEANEHGIERDESRLGLRIQMRVQSLTPTSMVADDHGDFHPMWVSLREGGSPLWTETVAVSPSRAILAKLPLGMIDLSSHVALDFADNQFDFPRRMISVDTRVVNRWDAPLKGPFLLQILKASSSLGGLRQAGEPNTGKVCEWNPDSYLVPTQILSPGQSSVPTRLGERLYRLRRTDAGELDILIRVCGYLNDNALAAAGVSH